MPITKNEILFEMDLSSRLDEIPRSRRSEAKDEIKVELLNAILSDVAVSKSPVDGSRFKKLSKEYKKIKKRKTGRSSADLRLRSDMLDSLRVANTLTGIKVSILQKKQILKAFNHLVGDTLPKRQFIPNDKLDETFRPGIVRRINGIIDGFKESA